MNRELGVVVERGACGALRALLRWGALEARTPIQLYNAFSSVSYKEGEGREATGRGEPLL